MTDAMGLAGASAGIAGVWAPWAGSWTAALGTTTLGGSTPVDTGMVFRIGDLTTPMTCTVLLALVDRGTVSLDDPLSKWVPGLVGVDGVTLRELCQSTSGIGDYAGQLQAQFVMNPQRQWPPLELASDGVATRRTGNPGASYAPSRTNAILVGMALQNATGQSWSDLYRTYIFGRLGMSSSSLPDSGQFTIPGPHPDGYAAGVDAAGARTCSPVLDVTSLSSSMGWTAAGAVSDLSDLKTFAQALASGTLVTQKSADQQATTVPGGASWERYGLGVQFIGPLRGSSGAVPGFLSAMYADPASGLTVVVALNNSTPGAGFAQALAQRLASIASKVPAVTAGDRVVDALPWSQQQMADAMTKAAPCAPKPTGSDSRG